MRPRHSWVLGKENDTIVPKTEILEGLHDNTVSVMPEQAYFKIALYKFNTDINLYVCMCMYVYSWNWISTILFRLFKTSYECPKQLKMKEFRSYNELSLGYMVTYIYSKFNIMKLDDIK